jgi:phosphomethylpyrimidine synthase
MTLKVTSRARFAGGRSSSKITEDVRKYAAQRGLTDAEAIEEGLKQKATEFNDAGAEIYAKA